MTIIYRALLQNNLLKYKIAIPMSMLAKLVLLLLTAILWVRDHGMYVYSHRWMLEK